MFCCQENAVCSNGTCNAVDECSVDSDCGSGDYCNAGSCDLGCSNDSTCSGCDSCVNHVCTHPECCKETQEDDCQDPSKPVCSSENVCISGCRSSEDCPGWDQTCDDSHTSCYYCNQNTNQCAQGCNDADNCAGYGCNDSDHSCKIGLKSITLSTQSCIGCEGAQVTE